MILAAGTRWVSTDQLTTKMFDAALCSAGIHKRYRDRFIDRGDGVLALIHPVDQAPKVLLLNRAIPAFNRLLTDHNASLPRPSRTQRQLRVRVVVHAGEVHYDANGSFGEALDVAFCLLDAARVKRTLREAAGPLILVVSGDIYSSVVRHGYDGIDQHAFHRLVRVQIAGGAGLATSVLSDLDGPVGVGAQSLLIAPRAVRPA